MSGKLYLIPATIGDTDIGRVIPSYISEIINGIRYYIVEEERTARRMLIKLGITIAIDDLTFFVLNKHTQLSEIPGFLEKAGNEDIGLLSEAGVPAIADPGSEIVLLAHQRKMDVIPLVGPSSILLAMMASGLNGQNFAFNGYLPIPVQDRIKKIKMLEHRSFSENQSQLFIETPYRNLNLFNDLLAHCQPETLLCIAVEITSDSAFIKTCSIKEWKNKQPDLNKRPAIFIIHRKK